MLYVGKAKNLRARLRNYFAPLRTLHERTRRMVTTRRVGRVDRGRQRGRGAAARDHLDQGVQAAVQRALQGRQVLPLPRGDARRRGAARGGHAQPQDPRRPVLRPVPEDVGGQRHPRADAEGVPDPHLHGLRLPACDGERQALLPRPDRQVRRPVLGPVTIEEHRANVERFVGVHAESGPAHHRRTHATHDAGPPRRQDYESAARFRDQLQAARRVLREERRRARREASTSTCSASSTTSSRPRCSSSSCAAVASAGCAAGSSTRSSTCRSASSSTPCSQNAYGDDCARRARSSCPSCPTTPRRSRPGWARCAEREGRAPRRAARRQGGAAPDGHAERQAGAVLYKTRRSADFVARSRALERHPGGARHGRGPAAHRVLRRLAPGRHEHRRLDGRVRRRASAQGRVPQVRDPGVRATTPSRSTRCSPVGWPTSRGLTTTSRRRTRPTATGEANGDDAEATSGRRKKFAYRPGLLIVDGGQPQVAAAARALDESGVDGIYRLRHRQAARRDLAARRRLPGHPAAQQRGAVPDPAHPRRGAPLRDHASSASGASATSARCSPRSRGSARRG